MFRELFHFIRHAPHALRLKAKLDQAALYHTLMEGAERAGLGEQRAALVRDLRGDILEIGAGTGLMFGHYQPGARVTAIEVDASFAATAREKARAARVVIDVQEGDARKLTFPDASFDAVVIALVLCSVRGADQVVAEARRVLRPGGQLRLIEHVRSDRAIPGALMVAFNWLWRLLNGQGCNMHRRPLPLIEKAGFRVEDVVPFQVFAPGIPAFPMRRIRASRGVDQRARASEG